MHSIKDSGESPALSLMLVGTSWDVVAIQSGGLDGTLFARVLDVLEPVPPEDVWAAVSSVLFLRGGDVCSPAVG